ncbi:endonuclease/exonuclease/phosphatase family protein [Microbulbifer bruguierae]|uniref:Endonuclease/exonuclease/phosphatase family protein n=1 Tax=Microbulbifer bruguierae TaxID=3029061 RepID=A0ABY8NH25_9GAMM|nr:endonuclease/exonuclease/phosphatase family protein [Microbulbifer bruguierae]WGL16997.1 endonuclease/exonuclease/phosphatase family protein [Microbulbifer bruguierae]
MLTRIESTLRRWRRRMSRSEWLARMLKLQINERDPDAPALVLIQVDGLARPQLDQALAEGKMPFLKKLIEREHYHLDHMYSGVPATTPAVQAEIFYGVKAAVPAFGFMSTESQEMLRMYESNAANQVEKRLEDAGHEPLLKQGSCYVSVFRAGALDDEAHFCPASKGWGESLKQAGPLALVALVLANLWSLVRTGALLFLELILSLVDFIRGLTSGQDFIRELMFIPTRIAITILLRELSTVGVKIDIARGLPVIYINFLGYDEQAHRRGPSSAFAHWTLKGIDDAIARIWRAAHRSSRRHYDVWIYSDHGQEDSIAYETLHGRPLADALSDVFSELSEAPDSYRATLNHGVQLQRVRLFGGQWIQKLFPINYPRTEREGPACAETAPIALSAMGPLALLYNLNLTSLNQAEIARLIVEKTGVPMVLYEDKSTANIAESEPPKASKIRGWWKHGPISLPQDGRKIMGEQHPFADEAAEDLANLCRHPDAGDFVISGWCAGSESISFAIENGSHGGAGPNETHAFALMPGDIHFPPGGRQHWRPKDIREAALSFLKAQPAKKLKSPPAVAIVGSPPSPETSGSNTRPSPGPAATISAAGPTGSDSGIYAAEKPSPAPIHRQQSEARPIPETGLTQNLRVMTYNVHICQGVDGKLSPERIARVIARYSPDVVALQEVDVRRQRTGGIDQAHEISRLLTMDCHFQPAMHLEDERYGDAIMSLHPVRLIKKGILPGPPKSARLRDRAEPRGALWVEVDFHGTKLQIFNTHLGLIKSERMRQVDALLGEEWMGSPACSRPRILVGDFNALPGSTEIRRLSQVLGDTQLKLPGHSPKGTFFSRLPKARIDYVFVDPELEVRDVHVPRSELTRLASDHLPLIVDLKVPIPTTEDSSSE